MSAYADVQFYTGTFRGKQTDAETLERLLEAGTHAVNAATYYRIGDLADRPPFVQTQVKLATCAMADHFAEADSDLVRTLGTVGGYSIGDVSLQGLSAGFLEQLAEVDRTGITLSARAFLQPTGLLDRRLR